MVTSFDNTKFSRFLVGLSSFFVFMFLINAAPVHSTPESNTLSSSEPEVSAENFETVRGKSINYETKVNSADASGKVTVKTIEDVSSIKAGSDHTFLSDEIYEPPLFWEANQEIYNEIVTPISQFSRITDDKVNEAIAATKKPNNTYKDAYEFIWSKWTDPSFETVSGVSAKEYINLLEDVFEDPTNFTENRELYNSTLKDWLGAPDRRKRITDFDVKIDKSDWQNANNSTQATQAVEVKVQSTWM